MTSANRQPFEEIRFDLRGIDQIALCGPADQNLRRLERRFDGTVAARGDLLRIVGPPQQVPLIRDVVADLLERVRRGQRIDTITVDYLLASHGASEPAAEIVGDDQAPLLFASGSRRAVRVRSAGQQRYVEAIREHDVVFVVGPAGTGKTYLAVVQAMDYLKRNLVDRIILVRPAVEAGEQLGFLPGDLQQKINPYLRPLYDALSDLVGPTRIGKYMESGIIEASPLAYMRGRTLNNAFVILDEAQNTTVGQMKMFLTRLGNQAKAVVTGDITQIDLAPGERSGLVHVRTILAGTEGVAFVDLDSCDTQRHPLVRRIVDAFAEAERCLSTESEAARPAASVAAGTSSDAADAPPAAPAIMPDEEP
jgi:phosphate starvation-inducible protein PhoH and related proteins